MADPWLHVLHEDEDLIVVDKPAGLVVHPSKAGEASSLIGRARLHAGHRDVRLVNRLDRETSGIVIIARHAEAARELGRLFSHGHVRKRYLAVVQGALEGEHRIDAPLGRDDASPVAIKDAVRDDGAPAVTTVRAVGSFEEDGGTFTRVEIEPLTGRKHQIRIHLAHAGHPVVGDKIYGPDETIYLRFVEGRMTADDAARLVLEFQALHASEMAFTWRGRDWRFHAPPGDRGTSEAARIPPAGTTSGRVAGMAVMAGAGMSRAAAVDPERWLGRRRFSPARA
ncbi:MAG: RluA family pseudouridine synthase [Vicinamibacterales bacterium]